MNDIIIVVILLFITYFLYKKAQEKFIDSVSTSLKTTDSKLCSQNSINDAYNNYIFGYSNKISH